MISRLKGAKVFNMLPVTFVMPFEIDEFYSSCYFFLFCFVYYLLRVLFFSNQIISSCRHILSRERHLDCQASLFVKRQRNLSD